VDITKKKLLGDMRNPGRGTYRPKGKPNRGTIHDFPDPQRGKTIPYGVYDVTYNEAGVFVGISHDTAEFAVDQFAAGGSGWGVGDILRRNGC
jgi:hypothetical protein